MPTYIYMGHGVDLLIPATENHTKYMINTTNVIPEGCTYNTIAETGDCSVIGGVLQLNKTVNSNAKPLLLNPAENYDQLSIHLLGANTEHAHLHRGVFHVKTPGQQYTNNHCTFVLQFSSDPTYVYRSGLYDIERLIDPPLPEESLDYYEFTDMGMTLSKIKQIYKGSVFPTADEVVDEITKVIDGIVNEEEGLDEYDKRNLRGELISNIQLSYLMTAVANIVSGVNQDELFRRFPGNHYNFSCRAYDRRKAVIPEQHQLWRRKSMNESRRPRPQFNTLIANKLDRKRRLENLNDFLDDILYDEQVRSRLYTAADMIEQGQELEPDQVDNLNEILGFLEDMVASDKIRISDLSDGMIDDTIKTIKTKVHTSLQFGGKRRTRRKKASNQRKKRSRVSSQKRRMS